MNEQIKEDRTVTIRTLGEWRGEGEMASINKAYFCESMLMYNE